LRRRDRWRLSLRKRLPGVDRIPLDGPIFVLGMQGGGTTLVARCLLRHPSVVSMSGGSDYWVATDELGFVRNRMSALPRTLWSSTHRDDLDHPLVGTEHASVYASDLLLPQYRNTADDATPDDSARFERILKEHLAVYADDPRTARFLDKTHTYTVKIPYLDRLLEDHEPYFVLVVRNPYTMCFRAVRRKPPAWRREVPYEEQLRLAAQHWRNSTQLALEDGPKTERFIAVRFEDFVKEPAAVVRAICSPWDFPTTTTSSRRPVIACPSRPCRGIASGTHFRETNGATRSATSRPASSTRSAASSRRRWATAGSPTRPRSTTRFWASPGSPRHRSSSRRALVPARDFELVLGVLDALLELPAVRGRLAALDELELPLGRLELFPGPASSISLAATASSTSAIARSCSTLKKPGPVANSRMSSA
jgi:hypothetical protein